MLIIIPLAPILEKVARAAAFVADIVGTGRVFVDVVVGRGLFVLEDDIMQLSDPFVTKNESSDSKWDPKTSLDIDITIDGGDCGIDLSDYHDFRVSVWFAQSGIDKYNVSNSEMLYFEIPESIAVANGYDRKKGIITYKNNGKIKYYYSTVLRSNKYNPWPACDVPCESTESTD